MDNSMKLGQIACKLQAGAALAGILREALEGSTDAASAYTDAAHAVELYFDTVVNELLEFAEEV